MRFESTKVYISQSPVQIRSTPPANRKLRNTEPKPAVASPTSENYFRNSHSLSFKLALLLLSIEGSDIRRREGQNDGVRMRICLCTSSQYVCLIVKHTFGLNFTLVPQLMILIFKKSINSNSPFFLFFFFNNPHFIAYKNSTVKRA